MTQAQDLLLVLSTCPTERAADLADALVGEGLAACVNVLPGVLSVYRWEGELCREQESLLLIKTTAAGYCALESRLRALHPYELPEIVALPASAVLADYLAWVRQAVRVPH